MKVWLTSSNKSLHDLAQLFSRNFCRNPEKMSKRSLHDPVQVLVRRSCGDPGQILSEKSLPEDLADAMSETWLCERSSEMLLGGSCIKML